MRAINDPHDLRDHLDGLTQRHEFARPHPWRVSDAPDDYIASQMTAVVGVHLQIDRLEGKWKMSQNRSDADIAGVIRALSASDLPKDRDVARIVSERRRDADANRSNTTR
jgi:transcriptional regulator